MNILYIWNILDHDLIRTKKHIFEKIYRQHLCKVIYFAQGYLGTRCEAEGVAQEVFITLWEKIDELDLDRDILPYLLILTRNKSLNLLKSKKEQYFKHSTIQAEKYMVNCISIESADSSIIEAELHSVMARSLLKMSPRVRKTFLLNRNRNMKYEEIARLEGISVKTVEYRIMSALRIFRQHYRDFISV